ncbi:hypothetical protein MSPP1_002107 [Malassezia sp. CBS 17886]|nr:hypothetical protein MSPP1_002107 [Malassezia sp. CBS 17886]
MKEREPPADQFMHHSDEPLGDGAPQSAPGDGAYWQAPPARDEPVFLNGGDEDSSPTREPTSGSISDATRYAPDAPASSPLNKEHSANRVGMPPDVERSFHEIVYPGDSYTANGTYWADLPWAEKISFCNRQSNLETRRELGVIWRMIKHDPLSPLTTYMGTYVLNGMGMFVEGYTLFSVGNIKPLFQNAWPACWKPKDGQTPICDKRWLDAVDYLEIVGIIIGQVLVGFEGDWVGRRFGMVQDAAIMTLGSVMLTAMWGTTMNGWVICYAWSLFIYGIGVGGEYPMTSTRAMEGSGDRYATSTGDRLHRGRNVLLAFLMQGWGQLFNQGILIILLLIFHHGSLQPPLSATSVQWTFRVSFALVAMVTLFLMYYRYYRISYTEDSLREAKARLNTSGYDLKSLKLALHWYWHRLFASCFCWFANDFFFYGNKIFAGVFISLITGSEGALQVTWLYNLINVGVQIPGYYLAALLVDNKMYGRKWMQGVSFAATFALFCGATFAYNTLQDGSANLKWFQFIYFFSSFWNQFGYNSTTFLVAAEIFPASIRATCHGFSAAWGKLGALLPTIIYNYVANHTKFYIVTWFGLGGLIVTFIFVPDTTGLDLREQERYWEYVMNDRVEDYHGVAICPRHLSLYERVVLKRQRYYNPQLDAEQKMDEFRAIYHSALANSEARDEDLTHHQREFLNSELGNKHVKDPKLSVKAPSRVYTSKLDNFEKTL